MKTAQYLAGLTTHEDVWHHIGEVMTKFHGADLAGFAGRGSEGAVEFHHLFLPEGVSTGAIRTKDVLSSVAEVLETGFLSQRIVSNPVPHAVAFLPIAMGNETSEVLLVGHAGPDPISNDLLNVYLAVAGLAGTTITRLTSETELKRHRTRLEELVAERTIELTRTMRRLEMEVRERKLAEEALHRAKDELEVRVRDRTWELTKANEDLKEKTSLAQLLLDALPCIALLMKADKVVVASNKRAADLGILPGTVCHEAWRSCQSACPWCLARETLTGDAILRKEIEAGEISWDVYWVPISSDLFLHYAFDITDRKQAERELKAYAERLELLNRELQEFAFVASHDLREPLRKIQAFGDRLVHKCAASLDEEAKDNVARMIKSAKRMSELLDALLRYSRVSTRGSPFQLTNVQEAVVDAMSDLELVIRRVDGTVDIGELPRMEADAIQLRQLFQNLIGNALKYHRTDEKPIVRIYGRVEGKSCRIFIEDNCIGFESKYVDHIFKPFERLHGHDKYEGLGMGLAICRKIVERHRGSITATSTPGKGSTFIVTLPVKQVPERRWATERE